MSSRLAEGVGRGQDGLTVPSGATAGSKQRHVTDGRALRLVEGPPPVLREGGGQRGLLARAGSWLLEPAEPMQPAQPVADARAPAPPAGRPVVAVFGLARGCGATMLARALACELGARDTGGVAAVGASGGAGGLPLAVPAASRLARLLADLPGASTHALGRLCLVSGVAEAALADTARHHAPLVLDAGSVAIGGVAAAVADHVLVVAGPAQEPALGSVAAQCLARVGPEPIVVLNREIPGGRWHGRAVAALPDSRLGAQLALGGRDPRGRLGRAVAELADLCQAAR